MNHQEKDSFQQLQSRLELLRLTQGKGSWAFSSSPQVRGETKKMLCRKMAKWQMPQEVKPCPGMNLTSQFAQWPTFSEHCLWSILGVSAPNCFLDDF